MSTDVLRGWTSHHGGVTVLVRTAALAAGWAAYSLAAAELTDSTGGANIGVGLLAFGLLLASVGLWAAADGSRRAYPQVAFTWVSVAALMGLLVPVFISLTESDFSGRVLLSDVLQVGPLIAALVAGPALVGGLVGAARGPARRNGDTDGPCRGSVP